MKYSLLLLTVLCLRANTLTATMASLSFGLVQYGQPPHSKDTSIFEVTGSGSGLTYGTCTGNGSLCSDLLVFFDGNTPTIAHVVFQGYSVFLLSAATYTAQFVITAGAPCASSCTTTISLSLQVVAPYTGTFTSISNDFTGFTTSGAPYLDKELVAIPNLTPSGTSSPPGFGLQQTDPLFGGVITNVGINRFIATDSVQSGITNNGLIITQTITGGNIILTKTNGAGDQYTNLAAPCGSLAVDPRDNTGNTLFCQGISGSPTILKLDLLPGGGGNNCGGQCNITTWITYSGNATKLENGGDGGISKDGFWAAVTIGGTAHKFVSLDLTNQTYSEIDIASIETFSDTFINRSGECGAGTYTSAPFCPPRLAMVTRGVDKNTNKRYFVLGSYVGTNWIFSQVNGSSIINDEGPMPLSPGSCPRGHKCKILPTVSGDCGGFDNQRDCRNAQHMDVIEVANEEYLAFPGGVGGLAGQYLAIQLMKFSVGGALMDTPVDFGGGLVDLFPINPSIGDVHLGSAAYNPVLITEDDGDPGLQAARITSCADNGADTKCTMTDNATFLNGQPALINGVLGNCTNVNNTYATVTGTGTTLTIPSQNCSPAGMSTSNTGTAIKNITPAQQAHQNRIWFYDFSELLNRKYKVIFLVNHRDWPINDWTTCNDGGSCGYRGQSHPTIDRYGKTFCYESNWGKPEGPYNVYCGLTGYPGYQIFKGMNLLRGKETIK